MIDASKKGDQSRCQECDCLVIRREYEWQHLNGHDPHEAIPIAFMIKDEELFA